MTAERTTGNVIYYGDQTETRHSMSTTTGSCGRISRSIWALRYERNTIPFGERSQTLNAISSVPGLITFGEPKVQNLNFMPRIGFAWSPGNSGNTSIRGGFGINYDKLFDNLGILSLPPQLQQTVDRRRTDRLATSWPTAASSRAPRPVRSSQADARANTGGFVPDQKLPKSIQWNIGVQRVFRENYTVEVRYLGTRGISLPVQQRINAQPVVNAQNALPLYYLGCRARRQLDSLTSTSTALTVRLR